MSDNWVVQNLQNALNTWNKYLTEMWELLTQSPEEFRGGAVWNVMRDIHGALQAVALALLVLFFVVGVMKNCGSFADVNTHYRTQRNSTPPIVVGKVLIYWIIFLFSASNKSATL